MKVIITATAPTVYQLGSIRRFGLPVKENKSGSFSISQPFDTIKEAKDFLKSRAEQYFDTDKELREAKRDIKRGYLSLDAVMAHIEKDAE